jgi:hypothetical protein
MKEVTIFIEQLLHAVPRSPAPLSNPAVAMLRGNNDRTVEMVPEMASKKDEARIGN